MTENQKPVEQNTGVPLNNGTPSGETEKKESEAPSKLPPSLQGKTPEQIAEMYVHLEKKLGEQSDEINTARQLREDIDIVLRALYKNPALYRQVEEEIRQLQGIPKEEKKEKRDGEEVAPDDVRKAEQNRVIGEFETQFKIKDLSKEKRSELNKRIVQELVEMRDPSGKKTVVQVFNEIPVDQLHKYLEKAFWLARKSVLVDEGSSITEEDLSSIGSLSASSLKSDNKFGLTEGEIKTAERLGVPLEKYAKQKNEKNK